MKWTVEVIVKQKFLIDIEDAEGKEDAIAKAIELTDDEPPADCWVYDARATASK